jgi:hypothetical protein
MTCSEREARTASAKQQLVFSKAKSQTRADEAREVPIPRGSDAAARAPRDGIWPVKMYLDVEIHG